MKALPAGGRLLALDETTANARQLPSSFELAEVQLDDGARLVPGTAAHA